MRETPLDPEVVELLAQRFPQDPGGATSERVALAIDRLPDLERDIVNALFWEGVSVRGLGRRLQMDRREVARRATRALEMLREAL
ncbi:MAG TPA: sigma factor-like helix-turn-helix DNA-binding protein [Acidimicrobiales bacterium]|nr:sigma factor-like helix-turn-helix DNA-binding protein [Acidimicrobiales bacterium]